MVMQRVRFDTWNINTGSNQAKLSTACSHKIALPDEVIDSTANRINQPYDDDTIDSNDKINY